MERKRIEYNDFGTGIKDYYLADEIGKIAKSAAEKVVNEIGKDYQLADLRAVFIEAMDTAFLHQMIVTHIKEKEIKKRK